MSQFSISRIGKLMQMEFLLYRKFYSILAIGTFLFTLVGMLVIWHQYFEGIQDVSSHLDGTAPTQWVWEKGAYYGVFLTFKLLIWFLVIAQSFKALRRRSSAELFLLLPASVLEKLVAQVVFLIGLAELILPFLFWLAVRAAHWIWVGMIAKIKGIEGSIDVSIFDLTFFLPNIGDQNWGVFLLIYGLGLILTSWFFLGSLYFGKWNVVLSPLTMFLTYAVLAGSSIALSRVLFFREEEAWRFQINVNQPEIFPDVPLIMLVLIFLLYAGSLLSYVIAYFKLKEREV